VVASYAGCLAIILREPATCVGFCATEAITRMDADTEEDGTGKMLNNLKLKVKGVPAVAESIRNFSTYERESGFTTVGYTCLSRKVSVYVLEMGIHDHLLCACL
jgi:hypothetical protein